MAGFVDPLQLLVDLLAEQLDRSVIIDDPNLRPLAVSAQLGQVDASRVDYILQRRTPEWILRLLEELDVPRAVAPVPIPGDPGRGTLPRLVFPLSVGARRVGLLWLIDEPGLTIEQRSRAGEAAEQAAALLAERELTENEAMAVSRRLIDGLVDPPGSSAAADRLRDLGIPLDGAPYALCSVRTPTLGRGLKDVITLSRIATSTSRRFGSRAVLTGTPRAEGVLILLAQRRCAHVVETLLSIDAEVVVGLRRDIPDLRSVVNVAHDAAFAADVAAAAPTEFDRHADWAGLGVYAGLQHLPRTSTSVGRLCPGASALLGEGNRMFEDTIRTLLALGANIQKTAAALHVHRTTLYWRLENVERIVGLDLADGDARLRLGVALKFSNLVRSVAATATASTQSHRQHGST